MTELRWGNPLRELPEGWIEKWAVYKEWLIKVWLSSNGSFECSYINQISRDRGRFWIDSDELDQACEEAEEKAIARINSLYKAV